MRNPALPSMAPVTLAIGEQPFRAATEMHSARQSVHHLPLTGDLIDTGFCRRQFR